MSPQFHVVFDHNFTTVPYLATQDIPPDWSQLVSQSERVTDEDYDLAKQWMDSQQNPEKYLFNQKGVALPVSDQDDGIKS